MNNLNSLKAPILLVACTLWLNSFGQTPLQNGSHWYVHHSEDFSNPNHTQLFGSSQFFNYGYTWGNIFDRNCCDNGVGNPASCSRSVIDQANFSTANGVLETRVTHNPGFQYTLGWGSFTDASCNVTNAPNAVTFDYKNAEIHSNEFVHYGFHTVDIRLDDIDGLHGAFWLFGANECIYNEIDIMESWTDYGWSQALGRPYASNGVHWKDNSCERDVWGYQELPGDIENNFVTFSAEWAPNYIIYYRNGEPIQFVSQEANQYDYIPKYEMQIMMGVNVQQGIAVPDPADLPATWEWDNYASYYYSNVSPSTVVSAYTILDVFAGINSIPGAFVLNGISSTIYTSSNIQIRATDNVTIYGDTKIEPDGSGSFTILTPDLDAHPATYM